MRAPAIAGSLVLLAILVALSPLTAAASDSQALTPTPTPQPNLPQWDNEGPYDGYWWFGRETWVPGYISLETWYTPAPRHMVGGAVFYAPGVMRATAKVRGLSLSGYVDGVSLLSPADIGQKVWLKRPLYGWEGPFLVVDCAKRADMWPIIVGREEVVEVGWDTAVRWGMGTGEGTHWRTVAARINGVQVWIGDRPPTFDDLYTDYPAVSYADWFLERARFSTLAEDKRKGRIYTLRDHPGCWVWWQNEDVYCQDDFYSAPWVNPKDYQPYEPPPLDEFRDFWQNIPEGVEGKAER